jgi:hypothetical protein
MVLANSAAAINFLLFMGGGGSMSLATAALVGPIILPPDDT